MFQGKLTRPGASLMFALMFFVAGTSRLFADNITIAAASFSGTTGTTDLGLAAFNPALGTLNSVGVTINGTLGGTFFANPPSDGLGGFVPSPYQFSVSIGFSGLPGNAFFSFPTAAQYLVSGVATAPGTMSIVVPFNMSFHFNSSTDLVGFSGLSSDASYVQPGIVDGTLAGFTQGFSPIMDELLQLSPGTLSSPLASITSLSATGAVLVQYDFTPPTTQAPEPASLFLLGTGLAGAMRCTRKRRQF